MKKFRNLLPNEIDCRPQQIAKDGRWCTLLLYKDARVDMNILDEVYGANNWQRTHEVINGQLFCNIDIWDDDKKCWVRKQDVGTESNMDKEKGRASDAMKRACFNVGIGRELYTAPLVFINLGENETKQNSRGGRDLVRLRFSVKEIGYNEHNEISKLVIIDNKNVVRYSYGSEEKVVQPTQPTPAAPQAQPQASGDLEVALSDIKQAKTKKQLADIYNNWTSLQTNQNFINALSARQKEVA